MTQNDAGMHYPPCQYIFSNTAILDPFFSFSFPCNLSTTGRKSVDLIEFYAQYCSNNKIIK
ncbi:hypothetical protein PILCRDRAFT_185879 [Piloderma croceum F 1598]|uniref:Uncharacterized protein n=1 Tax=Piloderma croceum (strain F 1598) TaxID=765440 RepID=A0A0C3CLG8_PILCF|nr:hypothetical protein PILCRDRAFT_185879 [Piloderma croceum F 1598]